MKLRVRCLVMAMGVLLAGVALAQDENIPLKNWTAPPYWTPPRAAEQGVPEGRMEVSAEGMTASAQSLPSSPVPFVAIAPCRIVDTRVATSDGFHEPNFADGETRTFDIPASTDCPGLPATSVAYSFNVQYRPLSVLAFITLFPTGTTLPAVSTLTASPAAWVEDAAIVPAGTSGQIDVYCQYAGRVIIDVNGYYAAQSLVSSLNTKTGDLTLAAGSNVTITPSTNTLTIAATGGPGGVLPTGATGQTLYSNGSAWTASSALTNDGTNVGISGNLSLPNTTATTGQIKFGGNPFIHNYGGGTFVGAAAGNFSMTGFFNTAIGSANLYSNTTGSSNTASGAGSLYYNTTGSLNTASGVNSLGLNTTGSSNTASGVNSLALNTTGSSNTASGTDSLVGNDTGSYNTANGLQSLYSNSTGWSNTASGYAAGQGNTTGSNNIALGTFAGYNLTTGNFNIDIGNQGVAGEGNTIRIGDGNQASAFMAGIRGVTTVNADAIPVVIDSAGQLGTVSSSIRFKRDVEQMGDASSRLMELRPVTFHYKTQPDGPLQYGLIAEEVEQVMPELVVHDATGQVETVAYHELPAMLLNELQKQQATIRAQQAQIERLVARLAAVEARLAVKEPAED